VTALWAGSAKVVAATGYRSLVVASQDADLLARGFGPPSSTVHSLSSAAVKASVTASSSTLGLLPAEDVTPDVRALAVDGVSLFGSERAKDLAHWHLMVRSATPSSFSPSTEWTLAAGGDVNLSREVYVKAVSRHYGPDYPWSAGYAVISGHECCGMNNAQLVVARNTGPNGALRARLADADLALVNLEGPAPDRYANSLTGVVFSFDPALLVGLRDAGIDAVTLANNHIRNAGAAGVLQTCGHLDAIGIAHTGAGANATAARQPAWLEAGGLRVAVLGYSAIGPANWATAEAAGAAPLNLPQATADIRAARAAGADIVIVMPHWGREFKYSITASQESEAAAFVAAGADLVLGSHSHWVGPIQAIDRPGGPAFIDYELGNLLFNMNYDAAAQEGVIVTLTFSGKRLVQVDLAPTVMIAGARVGLLDPAGDGAAVLDAIRRASRRTLDW